jgi:hypothetical protein
MTRIQKITIGLLVTYLVWEVVVNMTSKNDSGPLIRADLLVIYPVLLILIIVSLFQWLRRKQG